MFSKIKGYADFGKNGIVSDMDVWKFIKKHSRLIDRLDSQKMVEMTQWAFTILQSFDGFRPLPKDKNWKFYGKDGFFDIMWKNEP